MNTKKLESYVLYRDIVNMIKGVQKQIKIFDEFVSLKMNEKQSILIYKNNEIKIPGDIKLKSLNGGIDDFRQNIIHVLDLIENCKNETQKNVEEYSVEKDPMFIERMEIFNTLLKEFGIFKSNQDRFPSYDELIHLLQISNISEGNPEIIVKVLFYI